MICAAALGSEPSSVDSGRRWGSWRACHGRDHPQRHHRADGRHRDGRWRVRRLLRLRTADPRSPARPCPAGDPGTSMGTRGSPCAFKISGPMPPTRCAAPPSTSPTSSRPRCASASPAWRAGKTVFITALVRTLVEGGAVPPLRRLARVPGPRASLEPQPDDDVPRFAYEEHLAALAADPPVWPESTRRISELRLTLEWEAQDWAFRAVRRAPAPLRRHHRLPRRMARRPRHARPEATPRGRWRRSRPRGLDGAARPPAGSCSSWPTSIRRLPPTSRWRSSARACSPSTCAPRAARPPARACSGRDASCSPAISRRRRC